MLFAATSGLLFLVEEHINCSSAMCASCSRLHANQESPHVCACAHEGDDLGRLLVLEQLVGQAVSKVSRNVLLIAEAAALPSTLEDKCKWAGCTPECVACASFKDLTGRAGGAIASARSGSPENCEHM